MSEYPKIPSPFKRFTEGEKRNDFDLDRFSTPELEVLWNSSGWSFSEKLDGTNVRVMWDGHRPEFQGRTDRAMMPPALLQHLTDTFPEELLEDVFGADPATLYGEGIGPKINGGGKYCDVVRFVLFDVRIGKWWLLPDAVSEVATDLGISRAPVMPFMHQPLHAVRDVTEGLKSAYGDFYAEGVVGVAPYGLLSRSGNRVVMKAKHADLFEKDYDIS